ncbi:ComEA family DNA-binding protein [Lysobacter humi (ex Lee et al. 2017)]
MNFVTRCLQTLVLALALIGPAYAAGTPTQRVNVNAADAATLDRVLVNVGPAKAQAIVDYRKANGPFRSIDQLALVKGIGLKTIERNRDRIVIAPAAGRAPTAAAAPRAGGAARLPSRAANLQR